MSPLVRFESVQKSYDGKSFVIENLELSVKKSEFLTMLGPSGSGKTTCLMMLAGFEPITNGEIYLAEKSIAHVPPHKRDIGMVFQNYALFPHMTVGENLAFPLEIRKIGKSEREERIHRVLSMVQLDGYADRRPAQMSGGQQQRVAVARALVFEPQVVLMDEPLGALDKNLREQMQYEIRHLHEQLGLTVLYVTHDQHEALTISDQIAVFNKGEIQQIAAPETLYEFPENAFVAGFIGENNSLSGTVEKLDDASCQIRLDNGEAVTATPINLYRTGERVALSLRPERVQSNPENTTDFPNQFSATIDEAIYLGDHVRVHLTMGKDHLTVKIPNAKQDASPEKGEKIRIGWRSEDCRALPVSR